MTDYRTKNPMGFRRNKAVLKGRTAEALRPSLSTPGVMLGTDTQGGMLPRALESATCVQRFDDSLNSAIRITYRISLRSSSLWEPRYPLLRVVCLL